MDLDDESELSPVDESFIDAYEADARRDNTITGALDKLKQEEFSLRSTKIAEHEIRKTYTAPLDEEDEDEDDEDGDNQGEEDEELDNKGIDDQSRHYKKKKKVFRNSLAPRGGLRARGETLISAATTFSKARSEDSSYPNQPEDRKRMKFTKKNHWSNPDTPTYDVKRMLMSDECLAPDNLLRRPTPDFAYFTPEGNLRPAPQYDYHLVNKEKKMYTGHPKYAAHEKNGTANRENKLYYDFTQKEHNYPLAGKVDIAEPISEVRDLEQIFANPMNSDLTDAHLQEEAFNARPSIHLPIPDHIKAILVDDWENVTKNQQLVPLPATHTVESILNDYLAFENPKRQAGTHQAELLQEVVMGLKEYFEKCLGRILLYR